MAEFKINKAGLAQLQRGVAEKTDAFLDANRGKTPAEVRAAQKRAGLKLTEDSIAKLSRGEL